MIEIQTRKNEVRLITLDPQLMKGRYIANTIYKTWVEEFVDEDTGESVPIERKQIMFSAGTLINPDILAQIMFFQSAGDIPEIEVTNQQREAFLVKRDGLFPWSVKALIGKKKHRFLLYASNINMAIEIATDYIELNYSERFEILTAKSFGDCIMLNDNLVKIGEEDDPDKIIERKFYKIEVRVIFDEDDSILETFVIFSKDVDTAMLRINNWVTKKMNDRREANGTLEPIEFTTAIESALSIPCSATIDKDFSLAYTEKVNE